MKRMMGLISTNYESAEFGKLTETRSIASIPFGGRYRLVDFPLSNMVNSGINIVGLITPNDYRSLIDHVGVGKEWGLDRKSGGMFILPGSTYGVKNIRAKFLLRDILENRIYLERSYRDLVVISACSKLYNVDFRQVAEAHQKSGADVTLLYKKDLATDEPSELYLALDDSGRVTGIHGVEGERTNGFLEAIVINRELLLNILDWYAALSYLDFMDVLGENLDKMKVCAYEFTGYVAAISGLTSYMRCSLELLRKEVQQELFPADRPIITKVQDSPPAKFHASSNVHRALVSTGCVVGGEVESSVLFRGVTVEKGAAVKNCVLMQHCVVEEGAVLENVICDKYVHIARGTHVSGHSDRPISIGKKEQV